jgi:hypothetical protein
MARSSTTMSKELEFIVRAVWIGGIGTLIMDAWLLLRQRLFGVPPLNYALLGRWVGYISRGCFVHESIAKTPALRYERALGWSAHYSIGISFAALLLLIWGVEWSHHPTLLPALTIGLGTVIAPLFIMQPAMGLGIAGSKTPNPTANRLRSVVTHLIYGLGLYLAALLSF